MTKQCQTLASISLICIDKNKTYEDLEFEKEQSEHRAFSQTTHKMFNVRPSPMKICRVFQYVADDEIRPCGENLSFSFSAHYFIPVNVGEVSSVKIKYH